MKSIMFPITQCSLKPAVSVRRGTGSIQCLKMPQSINKNNHHYPHIDCLNIFGCLIVVSNPGLVSDVIVLLASWGTSNSGLQG